MVVWRCGGRLSAAMVGGECRDVCVNVVNMQFWCWPQRWAPCKEGGMFPAKEWQVVRAAAMLGSVPGNGMRGCGM